MPKAGDNNHKETFIMSFSFSGDRSFTTIAPKLWNDLPVIVRENKTLGSFKRSLKTHFSSRTL